MNVLMQVGAEGVKMMPNCQTTKLSVLPNELSKKELLDCWAGENLFMRVKVKEITGGIRARAVQ